MILTKLSSYQLNYYNGIKLRKYLLIYKTLKIL